MCGGFVISAKVATGNLGMFNGCECEKKINEALAPMNGRVKKLIGFDDEMNASERLVIATEKIDTRKRKSAPIAVASYCPWCGAALLAHDRYLAGN